MAGLFSVPKTPTIEVAAAPAVIDESKTRAKKLEELAKKRGRASQMLAGDYYDAQNNAGAIAGQAQASKVLLGQ